MSSASAAPSKTAPTNGFRRLAKFKGKNPTADFAADSLREQLISLKDQLGWTYLDLSKKCKMGGYRHAEMCMKTGGFRQLCSFARAMGVCVSVEIVP